MSNSAPARFFTVMSGSITGMDFVHTGASGKNGFGAIP